MFKVVEKKEWQKFVNKCWDVSNELETCVFNTSEYKNMHPVEKRVISKSIGKTFLFQFFNYFAHDNNMPIISNQLLYNTDSIFWNRNGQELDSINSQCNLFKLVDCCKETYNLDNMKGNYEAGAIFLKQKVELEKK